MKKSAATKAEKWKQELERTLEGFQAGTVTFEAAGKKVIEVLSRSLNGMSDGRMTPKESNALSRIAGKINSARKQYIADMGRRSA